MLLLLNNSYFLAFLFGFFNYSLYLCPQNIRRTAEDFIRKYHKNIIEKFTIENGNIVWGKNWDLIFPIEDLHAGALV